MERYISKFKETKIFKTMDDFLDFDQNADKGDRVIFKNVEDQDGNVVDIEIVNMGLDASWKYIKYKIDFFKNNKKIKSILFKNSEKVFEFLDLNGIRY